MRSIVAWVPHVAALVAVAVGAAGATFSEPAAPWLPPALMHPLGTDEFGRNILSASLAAGGVSLAKGFCIALATLIVALVLAEGITLSRHRLPAIAIRGAASVVESIPSVLWVMIVLIVLREPRLLVVGAAFAIVTLPTAAHVIAGELLRLRAAPFVEAAYQLGAGESRVLIAYVLPNARAVLAPYALQVLGAAIAVDGAIGVIGLGNRSDLDLGIFLLRGKENFIVHPQLLLAALAVYAAIYAYLLYSSRHARGWDVRV